MGKNLLVIDKSKNLLVKHSNKLSEARYFLTVGEQRLILLMVSMIDRKDEDFKDYEIKINDFLRLLNLTGKANHKRMEEVLNKLMERVLHIEDLEGNWLKTHWVSSAEYVKNKGIVYLCFDPKLKPYLLQLK